MSITDFKIQTQNVTRTLTRVFPEAWRAGPSLEGSTCVSPNNCFGALRDCWGGGSRVSASPEAKPWDLGVSRPTWTDAADSTLWADGEDQGQRTCTTEQIGLRERAGVRPALRGGSGGSPSARPPVHPARSAALRLPAVPGFHANAETNPRLLSRSHFSQQCFSNDHISLPGTSS